MTLITFSSNYAHSMAQANLGSINNKINNTALNLTQEYYQNSEKAAEHSIGFNAALRYTQNDRALEKVQEFSSALEMAETAHEEVQSHISTIQGIVDDVIEAGVDATAEQEYEVNQAFQAITDLYSNTNNKMFDGLYGFSTSDNSYSLAFGDYNVSSSTESFKSYDITAIQTQFSAKNYSTVDTQMQTIDENTENSMAGITADKAMMSSITNMIGHQQDSDEEMLSTLLEVDSASETSKLTQYQMLQQAATSILSQTSTYSSSTLGLVLKAGG